ncbi:SDR family NAD(P)-dependent oxidoreductase [Pseudocnuella soli]|uniref:SDR family NAD(P)-dependent oxidoreductase n=1 Tax=Pseudocnuella soli TaxID=2502779 RepID=UPI001045BE44|nr:SDR family NAD(P)-dependent oxidoreductase [Pseudocnuella soli]
MNILEQFSLKGKTALVTGCSRGIGKAMAEALAAAGADIIGVSASMPGDGGAVGQSVTGMGQKFYPFQCDFADRQSIYRFIEAVKAQHANVDILVNNAGTILRQPAAQHSDEYWDTVIAVNQSAQFILTREIGKGMIERGSGKIIFTASLLSFQGGINVPGYAASKGAIASLVKAFANEWAAKGVNVNAIAPGYIATDNTQPLITDKERSAAILSRIPAARWGNPEDLQGPLLFLASAASDYVHGTILTVDGGWMGR